MVCFWVSFFLFFSESIDHFLLGKLTFRNAILNNQYQILIMNNKHFLPFVTNIGSKKESPFP